MNQEPDNRPAEKPKEFTPEEIAAMREAGMPEDLIANACFARRWRMSEPPNSRRTTKLSEAERQKLAQLGYRAKEWKHPSIYGPEGAITGVAGTPQEAFGLAERLARREPVGFRAGVAPLRVQTIDQVTNRREFEIPEYGQLVRTIHRVADAFEVPVEALTPIFGGWYDTVKEVQSREISARVHLLRGSDPRVIAAAAAVMGTLAPHLQNGVMILNYDALPEQKPTSNLAFG
jgi:hypothetical protein